jgi:PAS domain S-box-containing protein
MPARFRISPSSGPLHLPWPSLGVALACLLATLAVTALFWRSVQTRDRARFENVVESVRDRIKDRLETYQAVLLATGGLFGVDRRVTASDFRRFLAPLELQRRYPGIQGVGFSLRLDPAERARVEAELRAQGQAGFRVWPEHARDEWHTIAFLEPLDRRNRAALGFDMSSEPVRREAMERARDTGLPAASGRVTLVQEIDPRHRQAGFLIYVPVYRGPTPATVEERRERLHGFVYAPFRMEDLLAGVFSEGERPLVSFEVFDGEATPERLLYRGQDFVEVASGGFDADAALAVEGRSWQLRFRTLPEFHQAAGGRFVPWVFGSGVLLSLLLFFVSRSRVRARDALQLQARVIESMQEGVSVFDASGVIRYTNPAEDRMFGYAPGELRGRPVTALSAEPLAAIAQQVARVAEALRAHGVWAGEFENVRKDGTRFTTAAHITPIELGGREHWVCVQQDVTERKRTEAERDALLRRERAARAEAEAANRAKDEFLAMLGHELRNPLAPIATALELLRLQGDGSLGPELAMIERQLRHVQRLVDDLLDVSRITRGKIELARRPAALARIVADAIEGASPLLERRKHRLVVDVPDDLVVDGDPTRLTQVVANLLTNAAKFTPEQGRIEVSAAREGDDGVALRVRDTGAGIAPELLPNVFDLFTQGQRQLDRAQGGLGIGLTLVRNLVEAHGGTVEARSDGPGKGAEFVIRLPAAGQGAPAGDPRPSRPRRRTERPRRVLVVDDNLDAAEALAWLLRAVGHEVAIAHDGPQALRVAADFAPEVAVLDLGLPVMDGYELAERLRERGTGHLIAVTGYGQDRDRARARAAGFAAHLVKPVDAATLCGAVEAAAGAAGGPSSAARNGPVAPADRPRSSPHARRPPR